MRIHFKVRRGDLVEVTVGGSSKKGQRGVVKKVFPKERKVIVDGVNKVTRHIKPDYRYPQGVLTKEMPIDLSNVAVVDPSTDKPGRVGFKFDENGNKVRYFKKSGNLVPKVEKL